MNFSSPLLGPLRADAHTLEQLGDGAVIAAWIQVEIALAKVQGELGVIPATAAADIVATLPALTIAPASLAVGAARDGVAIPALVAQLRAALPAAAADYLHWGATSQDIVDTGLMLRLRTLCTAQRAALHRINTLLAALADRHRQVPAAARTRFQQAVPTSFGLKAAQWLAPLLRQLQRLDQLEPRLLVLQFGGAAGNLGALGAQGAALLPALAAELGLGLAPLPWHNQRDTLVEYAGWLALTSGCLGKLGQDLLLLAQSEIGEVQWLAAGSSSTMPQKNNPVAAEALVALARYNTQQAAAMQQALLHANERDGSAWSLEWLVLPTMLAATAAALHGAEQCLAELRPNPAAMRANLDAGGGSIMAEAAGFALAQQLGPGAARALLRVACAEAAGGRTLADVLSERCASDASGAPHDWATFIHDYQRQFGSAELFIDAVLALWRNTEA